MIKDLWDETDTKRMCANDPWLEGMRQLLLRIERDGHKRGWDHKGNRNKLFEVIKSDTGFGVVMAGSLQDGFDECCTRRQGNVGIALLDIAKGTEHARAVLGEDPGNDLYRPAIPGTEVWGWGLLSEAWMVYQPENPTPEQVAAHDRAALDRHLNTHPDRIEGRLVQLVCRDGHHWSVTRERGKPPVALVQKPESLGTVTEGNIPYALGRILNAIVSNPVPVPSRGTDFWKQQGRR